ncbi:hypothetical protein [Falsiporphyromonas endometrii]|uniref:Lipoprotein n=1 Tax=Falsiporphyromonas endometrii TaxID=1387297 RepID=A0ABV9K8A4_9PORP
MNKKFFVGLAIAALMLTSCGKNSSACKDLQAQYDSIAAVNEGHEREISQMDSLISSVLLNFQEINRMEGMINVSPTSGEMRKSQKERIEDNMKLINEKMQANRQAIEELNAKLAKYGQQNKGLKKTIESLKRQFNEKSAEVQRLQDELVRKNLYIGMQDSIINKQNSDLNDRETEIASQKAELAEQDKQIHTVRYCIGTNADLKEMGVLVKGRLNIGSSANMNYFTTGDLRKISQIPLHSKKADILTSHPSESYELIKNADKMLTLVIKNADKFWSNSKVLVVKVK